MCFRMPPRSAPTASGIQAAKLAFRAPTTTIISSTTPTNTVSFPRHWRLAAYWGFPTRNRRSTSSTIQTITIISTIGTTTTIPRVLAWPAVTNITAFYQMKIVVLTGKTTNAGKCIGWNLMAVLGTCQMFILITLRRMPVASAS